MFCVKEPVLCNTIMKGKTMNVKKGLGALALATASFAVTGRTAPAQSLECNNLAVSNLLGAESIQVGSLAQQIAQAPAGTNTQALRQKVVDAATLVTKELGTCTVLQSPSPPPPSCVVESNASFGGFANQAAQVLWFQAQQFVTEANKPFDAPGATGAASYTQFVSSFLTPCVK